MTSFCSTIQKLEQTMESHAQSVEDNLIDSLSFKLRPGASYVTDRRSVSFWPQGGNDYAPSGVKVIKIMLTGDSWLDPSTVKLFFNVTNNTGLGSDNLLKPMVTGAWGFFRRLRILCGGQIVEDINEYNRLHEMFHIMKPAGKRANDDIEGFGIGDTLAKDASRTVCFTPMSGLLSQDKYLPIRYAPLQLELEVVSSGADVVNKAVATNQSESFQLTDVQLKADLVTLDNSLDNEYSQHLLSGKSLPIHFSTFTTASQIISQLNSTVNVSRALTRLKAVFVTLSSDDATVGGEEVNNFYHPMFGASYDFTKEIEFEMQIGSKKFPEYPMRSLSEQFYQLRKTLGIHALNNDLDISTSEYRNNKFLMGIDTEKVLGASFSGYNRKAGDLLTLKIKGQSGAAAAFALAGNCKMHYVLAYDSSLQIQDVGCSVLE